MAVSAFSISYFSCLFGSSQGLLASSFEPNQIIMKPKIQLMKNLLLYFSLLMSIGMLISCEEEEPLPPHADCECDETLGPDDCSSYVASNISQMLTGSWTEFNQRKTHVITAPGDPGGGYARVTLTESDANLEPVIIVDNELGVAGVIDDAGSEIQFEFFPGMTYQLEVYPFFNADEYPVDYQISYEFIGKVDCFEPNNTLGDATLIKPMSTYEATIIAGYRDYIVGSLDEHTYDWYKVEICEPRKMSVAVTNVPSSVRIATRWMDASMAQLAASNSVYEGAVTDFDKGRSSTNTLDQVMPVGVYYIELHGAFIDDRVVHDGDPIPEHFNQAYNIRVDFED